MKVADKSTFTATFILRVHPARMILEKVLYQFNEQLTISN